ncbi:RagB/SusD family nutrient uptake outer membrane protein [Lewinella sp. JB7]|uniref:RagB/SusD family nutrient uptake outer membrane protein n=1 Tax=Lewinella sp. JB7 TaxID=2962887 RepID=UPI0020CA2351|nr:RagB/SusD family nutrient uptake outer membrane protein [Lewinella sp. JB7]MCP9235599.1 RagB/SusD family nutrient uptake outer membrane protein [Lewinella sp. JB7]
MIKQIFRITSGVALAALTLGCDDFSLDAVQPIDSVPLNLAVTDAKSAGAARAGVYNELQDATLTFDGYVASYTYFSDDSDWTGTFPTRAQFDNYNVLPSNGTMASVWADYYDVINTANNLLDVLPGVEDASLTESTRNSLLAEARFGRAIAYFHLVTGWGGVPIVLTPTVGVGEELNVPASTAADVYAQVIEDAQFAADNLGTGSLGMNPAAANALLARVALMQGRYDDAGAFATLAIGADYDLTTVPYLEDEIFYLKFSSTDGQSNAFFFGASGIGASRYSIAPSQKLDDAYEEGDERRDLSIAFTDGGVRYGIKYDDFQAAAGSQNDPIYFFRAAEQVLILAEVAARNGDFDTADKWINQVRNRAGLDDIELDADNFEDAILQERFVELAMEGGFRLWDLRRTGRAVSTLGPDGYDPCDDVWPFPQDNIDTNTALQQNNCCNC